MGKSDTERLRSWYVRANGTGKANTHVRWIGRCGLLLGLAGGTFVGLASAQSANLIQNPQELDKWKPIQGISVNANVAVDPNGAMTAEQLNDVANGQQPRVQADAVTSTGGSYVFSCYARAGSLTQATLMIRAGGSIVAKKTVSVSSTWQRIYVPTSGSVSAGKDVNAEVYPGTNSGQSGHIFAWGAQLEGGTTPTPYSGGTSDTPQPQPTPVQAPTGLTALWNGSVVQVRWAANREANLAGYRVERGANSSTSFSQVSAPTQPAYDDSGVLVGNSYSYRVRAVDTAGGVSGPSAVVSVTIPTAPVTVSAPTGLSATWNGSSVQLQWRANPEAGITGYRVERGVNSSTSFSQIATPTQPSHSDATATAGNTYAYRVRAVAGSAVSDPSAVVSVQVPSTPPIVAGKSRGYLTTPQELQQIRQKASAGVEPYKSAVNALLSYAGSATNWPHGTVDPTNRDLLHKAAALIYAKGMAYHLTGNSDYAASARQHILALTTKGTGRTEYSGGNGDILTLGRHIPGYIFGADLIEGFSGWTAQDKRTFQTWLANQVYHKVDWASDERSTNWGSVCSAAAAVLADYLAGSGLRLRDRNGAELTPKQAYQEANQRQKDRMNGNSYMYNSVCSESWGLGFRPDGGIPEELGRGSAGCDGKYLLSQDSAWSYIAAHLSGTLTHAELMLRRGDRSLFDNIKSNGGGSILRAIHFVIQNPNDPSKSFDWIDGRKTVLEIAYRYYRDPAIAQQLGIGGKRHVAGASNSANPHFGTLTHGFAVNENPGLPPVTAPPAE